MELSGYTNDELIAEVEKRIKRCTERIEYLEDELKTMQMRI